MVRYNLGESVWVSSNTSNNSGSSNIILVRVLGLAVIEVILLIKIYILEIMQINRYKILKMLVTHL